MREPATLGASAAFQSEKVILEKVESWKERVSRYWNGYYRFHTFRTMAPWMQPLTGGMVLEQSSRTCASASEDVISHAGASTWTS